MGYSVVTTVLSPASGYDLTDLATAKDELQIRPNDSSSDAWISRAIRQVSAAIGSWTKRTFAPELVQDAFDLECDPYPCQTPGGFAQLQLTRYPVLAVSSVVQTLAPGQTQTLTEGKDFRTDPASGQLLRLSPFTGLGTRWDALPVTVQYLAGFGALVQEAITVDAAEPYEATVTQAAAFSCDDMVGRLGGTALVRVATDPGSGQYRVAQGVYGFNADDAGASLAVTYAVLAIPDDIVDVTLRLITSRYSARGRDPSLVQQDTPGVGMQRWWFGSVPGQSGPFSPDIEAALEPYCMPVIA